MKIKKNQHFLKFITAKYFAIYPWYIADFFKLVLKCRAFNLQVMGLY